MPRKTNFTTNGHNYYRVTATVGKNPGGAPVRKQFYGDSKKAAEQKRDEYMAGLKQGLSVGYDKATFGKAFEHWLEHVQRHAVGLSTYDKYSRFHRLYIADCGLVGMRLIDVKAANIQAYYNGLLDVTTAKNVHQIGKLFNIFFKYCLKSDALIKNPLLAVKLPDLPKQPSETNTALSDSDIEKLVQAAKDDIKHFPFVFCAFTGLREGELLALTFKDIDFHEGMVSVNKSVKYLTVDGAYKPLVSETKTPASVRRVPILDEIRPLLQAHIMDVRQRRKVFTIGGDFLLFPSATGEYREQANFLQAYKRLCKSLGITQGATIHSLRHTFCTVLARSGVSLLDASRLMGHSNVNITAKIYSHVTDNDKRNAVQKLAAYFA
jgi:integrase